jgi:hypothetical protein
VLLAVLVVRVVEQVVAPAELFELPRLHKDIWSFLVIPHSVFGLMVAIYSWVA